MLDVDMQAINLVVPDFNVSRILVLESEGRNVGIEWDFSKTLHTRWQMQKDRKKTKVVKDFFTERASYGTLLDFRDVRLRLTACE